MATTTRPPGVTNQGQGSGTNMYGVYDRSSAGSAFYKSAWFWTVVLVALLIVFFAWIL